MSLSVTWPSGWVHRGASSFLNCINGVLVTCSLVGLGGAPFQRCETSVPTTEPMEHLFESAISHNGWQLWWLRALALLPLAKMQTQSNEEKNLRSHSELQRIFLLPAAAVPHLPPLWRPRCRSWAGRTRSTAEINKKKSANRPVATRCNGLRDATHSYHYKGHVVGLKSASPRGSVTHSVVGAQFQQRHHAICWRGSSGIFRLPQVSLTVRRLRQATTTSPRTLCRQHCTKSERVKLHLPPSRLRPLQMPNPHR